MLQANIMNVESKCSGFSNADNLAIYQDMSRLEFDRFLVRAGLDGDVDLQMLASYIVSARSILIIGGGFGREITFIRKLNQLAHIEVLERAAGPLHSLESFSQEVTVRKADVMTFKTKEKFDLVLMLFGTIQEFSPVEYDALFKQLGSFVSKDGVIFVDSMSEMQSCDRFSYLDDDYYEMECQHQILKACLVNTKNVYAAVQHNNLHVAKAIHYQSKTSIDRTMYQIVAKPLSAH